MRLSFNLTAMQIRLTVTLIFGLFVDAPAIEGDTYVCFCTCDQRVFSHSWTDFAIKASHNLEHYQTKSDPGTVVFYNTDPFALHG